MFWVQPETRTWHDRTVARSVRFKVGEEVLQYRDYWVFFALVSAANVPPETDCIPVGRGMDQQGRHCWDHTRLNLPFLCAGAR